MLPSKVHTLVYNDKFLGCFPKYDGLKTKVFGFVKKPHVELIRSKIKSDSNQLIQELDDGEFIIRCNEQRFPKPTLKPKLKPKPMRKQATEIMTMDVHECITTLTLNNLDLVLIDDIKPINSDIILYSNYKIDVDIDEDTMKEYIQYLYENSENQ
jgi:hypothetical protein